MIKKPKFIQVFIFFSTFNSFIQVLSAKPDLIILTSKYCPYCEQMEAAFKSDVGLVKSLEANFNILKIEINSQEGKNLSAKFKITGVPTIIKLQNEKPFIISGFGNSRRILRLLNLPIQNGEDVIKKKVGIIENIFSTKMLTCGNGMIEAGEQCDDGNGNNTDACLNTCFNATCGDGYVRIGIEQCDDGNLVNGDGCENTCMPTPMCGNGMIEAGEQCDDGNGNNTDACLNTCFNATCGDGYIRIGIEQCDDGNLVNGDGCNSSCNIENIGVIVKSGNEIKDPSAMLEIASNSKGLLPPRLTSNQISAMQTPAFGLIVFNSDSQSYWHFGAQGWVELTHSKTNGGFLVRSNSNSVFNPSTAPQVIIGGNVIFDEYGTNYISTSGLYHVSKSGVYNFTATVDVLISTGSTTTSVFDIEIQEVDQSNITTMAKSSQILPANFVGNFSLNVGAITKFITNVNKTVRLVINGNGYSSSFNVSGVIFGGNRVY